MFGSMSEWVQPNGQREYTDCDHPSFLFVHAVSDAIFQSVQHLDISWLTLAAKLKR